MARTRTLLQLRSDVCDRADVTDGGTTGRHTSVRLNRYINQAIQKYITLVCDCGGQNWYSKRTGPLSMGSSTTKDANGWAPNMYVPVPSDFFSLIGIDMISGNSVTSLSPFEVAERNAFRDLPPWWLASNAVGMPRWYRIAGANAAGTQVIEVIPYSDGSGYQYEIRYIPVVADLVLDADTFDGRAGFEEYVANRAALDILLNDNNTSNPLYGTISAENAEIEQRMRMKFTTMGPGFGHRIDTEEQREWADARRGWR